MYDSFAPEPGAPAPKAPAKPRRDDPTAPWVVVDADAPPRTAPLPSTIRNRYRTGQGEAFFDAEGSVPAYAPGLIHPLIPAADTAWAAWQDANAEGRDAYDAYMAARDEHNSLTKPTTNERELSKRVVDDLETEVRRTEAHAKRTLAAYDDLVTPRLADADVQALLARRASDAHQKVQEALVALEAAVSQREESARRLRSDPAAGDGIVYYQHPLSGREYAAARQGIASFDQANADRLIGGNV